jgi:hypothetical protein
LQFRLSTWFVLVAILGWAFVTRPYVVDRIGDYAGAESGASGRPIYHVERGANPQLQWPALALATFLAWKAAWPMIDRRRRQATL